MAYVTPKTVPGKGGTKRKVWLAKWKPAGTDKEREKSFELKREARAHADYMARTAEKFAPEPDVTSNAPLTFDAVADEYLESLAKPNDGSDPLGNQTLRTYRLYLKNVPKTVFFYKGGFIQSATDADVEEVRDQALRKLKSRRAATETLRLTKAVLAYAKAQNYIKTAPGQDVKIAKSKRSIAATDISARDEIYTPDHLRALLKAADALAVDPHKVRRRAWATYRPLAYLLIGTGLRISEARGLPRKNLDLDAGVVKVRQKATEDGQIDIPKSEQGIRDVPLPPECIAPLRDLLQVHNRNLLFSTSEGTPMGYQNLYNRMWKVLVDKAGVPLYGFHAVRHAYASRLIAAHVDLKTLQVWMGHHDPAFTLRVYGHLLKDQERDAATMAKISLA